jgi:hypothetical protein
MYAIFFVHLIRYKDASFFFFGEIYNLERNIISSVFKTPSLQHGFQLSLLLVQCNVEQVYGPELHRHRDPRETLRSRVQDPERPEFPRTVKRRGGCVC